MTITQLYQMETTYKTQDDLLMKTLMKFYRVNDNLEKVVPILNGTSGLSIRIIDWFVANYSKQYFVVYTFKAADGSTQRFKVYNSYKLMLKAYSKKRFDPFCRYDRVNIHYKDNIYVQTTIGQLNFFKWAISNKIIEYIESHKDDIETDMNARNSTAKKKMSLESVDTVKSDMSIESAEAPKTRKKREELSKSAIKGIKKEEVEIEVHFSQ
jgi:hypothetical protein